MRKILVLIVIAAISIFTIFSPVSADELEEIQNEINSLQEQLDASKNATTPLEAEVENLDGQIVALNGRLVAVRNELAQSEEDLEHQKEVLAQTVRKFYINSYTNIPLLTFFTSGDAAETLKLIAFQQNSSKVDKNIITSITEKIAKLAADRIRLGDAQTQLDRQSQFLKGEIASARAFQSEIEGKIAALSARQQEIISARSGTAITSVGAVPIGSDFNATPAYNPGFSPAFAAFSFGAYTHRNGMSQYGAKGQAEDGKSYSDIISWYYGHGVRKDDGMPSTISVQGYGDMDFQTYLYGIAEMPSSWPGEALKAQAVAARTYANRSGKPICTTEACQVFSKSKSDNPPDAWKAAVDATNKEIIDGDVSSQYSSTAGGYLNTSGWDTSDRSNSGDWTTRAWETKGDSPWFYKGWYRSGYTNSGNSCGKSSPWLTQEEFSDIVNAAIVLSGTDDDRILPTTINQCPIGGSGGSPYSIDEMRNKANEYGGAVTSVSSVTVSNNNSGQTTSVSLNTNRGTLNIPGSTFKQAFNLRAPGYISIPQSGFAFFNIEKK